MPRPPLKARELILADRRKRILESAAVEIALHGFNAANVNTISQSAGFATGTIYNYFPSKRALMLALIDFVAGKHTAIVCDQVLLNPDPLTRLSSFFQTGFQFVEENPSDTRVVISAIYGPDEEFRNRVYKAYDSLFTLLIEDILMSGSKNGVFRPFDPYTAAALIMSIYLGASSQSDAAGRIWLKTDEVVSFLVEGIRA